MGFDRLLFVYGAVPIQAGLVCASARRSVIDRRQILVCCLQIVRADLNKFRAPRF